MADYLARTEVLDSGAMEMVRVTNQLDASLQALEGAKQRYTASNAGHTIEHYDEAQARWNAAMNEMRLALAQAQRDLLTINENYISVDQRNAAMMPSGQP